MQNKFRAIATGAALAITVSLAAGSALAQDASDAEPGKPLSLLQLLTHHGSAKKPEAKTGKPAEEPRIARTRTRAEPRTRETARGTRTAERHWHHRTHLAARHRGPARLAEHENLTAAPAVSAAAPVPTPSPAFPLADMSAATKGAPDTAAATPPPAADPQVSELVVDGRTVQIASPDQANAIDLAAADQPVASPPVTAAPADAPSDASSAMTARKGDTDAADDAAAQDDNNNADSQAKSDHVVAFARQADSPASRPSWLAELLATLGGALAAGSVAWFLIGSAPQRTYG